MKKILFSTFILIFFISTLWPKSASAAFGAFVQCATAIDSSGTSATIGGAGWTSNITAGNFIIIGWRVGATGRTVTVTSDSTPATFTEAKNQAQTTDGHTGYIFHGLNQAGGVKPTITVSISGAAASLRGVACEYAGSANTHVDKTASAEGSGEFPNSGATATRTDATELQIGVVTIANDNAAIVAGDGFTKRSTPPEDGRRVSIEDILRTATGTEAANFSISGDNWTMLTATYSDAAAAGGRDDFYKIIIKSAKVIMRLAKTIFR